MEQQYSRGETATVDTPRLSGVAARRTRWRIKPRGVAFVDLAAGVLVGPAGKVAIGKRAGVQTLLAKLPDGVEQVMLVGARPGRTVDGFRAWAHRAGDQHFWLLEKLFDEKPEFPVVVYTAGSRRVELHRAAAWFGEGDYTPAEAMAGWASMARAVAGHFDGAPLLATPAGAGRYLWASSIGWGKEWDCLTDEDQQTIRATAGQGRIEALAAGETIAGLAELDGRFMYGALCSELGGGPAIRDTRPDFDPYAPGRYRVTFTVPHDWAHVGLLGVRGETGWTYPARPGWVGETWADGVELHLAQRYGWPFVIHERLLYAKGDPLGPWAGRLLAAWRDVAGNPLAQRGLRAMLIKGLGAFVGRAPMVTRSCPETEPGRVPPDAIRLRLEGDHLVWAEQQTVRHPEWVHPEWPARVWARGRARLLSSPGRTGALHVERASLVGFSTDAIWLDHDPRWADDGKPGRYRLKSFTPGPLPAPASLVHVHALKAGRV